MNNFFQNLELNLFKYNGTDRFNSYPYICEITFNKSGWYKIDILVIGFVYLVDII